MKLDKDRSRILILSHFLLNPIKNDSAASTAIRNHLLNKIQKIVQIEQPFFESSETNSTALVFENSKQIGSFKGPSFKAHPIITYIIQPLEIIYFLLRIHSSFELAIACENLSFLAALPFRKIGLIKKLVYYSIDYVPERFGNRSINSIYHFLDRVACYHSDVNWVVSKQQIRSRFKNGVNENKCSPFRIVPISYNLREIEVKPIGKINYYNLIFVGTVRPTAGPQLIIEALPAVIKKFPKIKITFAGGGEYIKELKIRANKLKVSKHLEFLGYIDKHKDMLKAVIDKSLGLAPYVWDPKSISMTSDPAKIKIYLACGLPVITTKVATSWKVILKEKAGLVIDYKPKELADAVIFLLSNKKRYLTYRSNALKVAQKYDVDRILKRALLYV